jgi:hypothetical protein
MTDLKFTAYYRRKVQPQPYEYIAFGLEEEFPKSEITRGEAIAILKDQVEKEIDRRIQELYAEEREKKR